MRNFALAGLLSSLAVSACGGSSPPPPMSAPPVTTTSTAVTKAPVAPPSTGKLDVVLQATLEKIVGEADGKVSISVKHLGNGMHASVHGDLRLPMMSVFKLPLSIVALSMVEDGTLKLDQVVPIAAADLRWVSPIADEWKKGTHAVTLETMIVRTIQDSDNTAGDKLVVLEGGGEAITARLRKLGIEGVDIAEEEIEMGARITCPGAKRPKDGWTMASIDACPKTPPAAHLAAGQAEIDHSPNGATADAIVGMLGQLESVVIAPHRTWLKDTLAGTKTGTKRLKALLPAGTRIEHKTGTGEDPDGLNTATNDVGVIVLPDGGRVAIAVLTAGSRRSGDEREGLIAKLGKATWDHFVK